MCYVPHPSGQIKITHIPPSSARSPCSRWPVCWADCCCGCVSVGKDSFSATLDTQLQPAAARLCPERLSSQPGEYKPRGKAGRVTGRLAASGRRQALRWLTQHVADYRCNPAACLLQSSQQKFGSGTKPVVASRTTDALVGCSAMPISRLASRPAFLAARSMKRPTGGLYAVQAAGLWA